MSKRTKYLSLIILAQGGCLGVGLWMHERFATSSTTHNAEEQVWSDIEAHARVTVSSLRGLKLSDGGAPTAVSNLLAPLGGLYHSRAGSVILVDSSWRVVYPTQDHDRTGELATSSGAPLEWTPSKDQPDDPSSPPRGRIILPDGPHIAVASVLENGQGHVLSHYRVADFEARSSELVQSSPVIALIAFLWTCALLGIAAYLILARLQDEIDRERSRLATEAHRQTHNLVRTRDAIIFGLAKLAESRDPDTGDHLERISVYSTMIASALRRTSKFRDEATPAFVRVIGISSALHDIGKVGLEDRILLKPGPLLPGERIEMETHTTIGGECLRDIEQRLGGSNFLQMAREITFAHHESWDGSGYPNGLAGTAIPLSARVVAIADIYDALSSKRVYKDPLPHDECVSIIRRETGKKLDPDLVDVWLMLESKFRTIALKYADSAGTVVPRQSPDLEMVMEAGQKVEELCAASYGASNEHR